MIKLRKPNMETLRRFLDAKADQEFTYQEVGATAAESPADYVVDHTRVSIGEGEQVFAAGKAALETWRQFALGWVVALPADTPLEPGNLIAIVARSVGLWWVNACRIVYLIDQGDERQKKYGFAYGTLPDHVGSGEERFSVEMDENGVVWYDILAFSRPHGTLARIGYPYMRYVQKQFGRQSAAVMQAAVTSAMERPAG